MVDLSASPTTSDYVIDKIVSKDKGNVGNNQNQENQSEQQQDNLPLGQTHHSTPSVAAVAYAHFLLCQAYYLLLPIAHSSYGDASLGGTVMSGNNDTNADGSASHPPMPYCHPSGMPSTQEILGIPPATSGGSQGSSLHLLNVLLQKEDEISQGRVQLSNLQMQLREALTKAEALEKQMERKCQSVQLQTKQSLREEFEKERLSLHKQHQQAIQQLQKQHEQTLKLLVLSLPQPPAQQERGLATNTLRVTVKKSTARTLEKIQEFGPYCPRDFDESSSFDDSTTQTSRDDKDDRVHVYKNEPGKDFKPSASDAKKELPKESDGKNEKNNSNDNAYNNKNNDNNGSALPRGFSSDIFKRRHVDNFNDEDNDDGDDDDDDDDADDTSLDDTMASSTFGDDRLNVKDKLVKDPYGGTGLYTGIVLRSTGLPHGKGKMVYIEDEKVYDGDWRHGRCHGVGCAKFINGDSYDGEYKCDKFHGRGVYKWADGKLYNGSFVEGKRHGKGVFIWPYGAIYEGEFVNGQREGHGKFQAFEGGPQYEGEWKDGKYDGYGTCTREDGRIYSGEWKGGMANGQFTETNPDGTIRQGLWIDDEPFGEFIH